MKGTLILSILCLMLSASFAQNKLTKISGKIVDSENGTPLVGATIALEDGKGVKTDVEGNFFLQIEKGKKYKLKISNVGFQSKIISDVQASDNQSVSVSLQRSGAELVNVVVTASARKESVANLYAAQKNSSSISDGISSEVIKRSPDRNTGEILKRVSGASVQDNKFVVIRGLSERYNASLLNNSVLPSTEPDKKAFSFDIIPSALIDNLVIYKSATPDLPGDFSGGAIKISTKDYPSKKVSELGFSMGYNSLTTFNNFYKGYPEGSLDFLGIFDNKARLIPYSYYKRRASFISAEPQFKREVTKRFPNTYGYEAAGKSLPNFSFNYTGGDTKLIGSNKLGYIYSVGYGTGRRVADRTRDEFAGQEKRFIEHYNTTNYDVKNNLSALLNLTYSYGRNKLSWKNLFNNDFTKTIALRNGYNDENVNNENGNYEKSERFFYQSTNTEAMNNGLFNSVLEGMHKSGKHWIVDWAGSYGLTYRNQPDQRVLTFIQDSVGKDFQLKVGTENSPEIRNAGRVYSYLLENIYGGNLNATRQFNWLGQVQKLKFGTNNFYRNRNMEVNAVGYGSMEFESSKRVINEGKNISFATVLRPENIDKYNLTLANIATNSTDYTGQAMSNAAYLMLDNKFSDNVKLTWGVRAEKYWQNLKAKNKPETERDNLDVLPSFIFTYSLNNKSNLRFAGSQSVNRPEFRELADYSVYDYENYITITGNPELERSKNTNADLRYEWFPSGGEVVSASIFYKYFINPIEQINWGNNVYSYANADYANALGAEVEVRKKLDFINSGFFSHLTAYANAAYIKGSVRFHDVSSNNPMQGQSPYLVNTGLTYSSTNDNFSVNALYNKIGPRLRFRAAPGRFQNIYEKPRDVIDVQVSKKFFHNRIETKLTVSDLLAQSFAWYYKFDSNPSDINYNPKEDRIMNSYKYGTTATLSVKFNLGK